MSNYFLRWNKLTVINLKDILSELLNVKQNKEKKNTSIFKEHSWGSDSGVPERRVPSIWRFQIIEGSRWFCNLILKWLFNSKLLKAIRGFKQHSASFDRKTQFFRMDALVMASLIFYGLIISFGSYWYAFCKRNKWFHTIDRSYYMAHMIWVILYDMVWFIFYVKSIESVFTAFYEFVTHWQRYHKEKHTSIRDHV